MTPDPTVVVTPSGAAAPTAPAGPTTVGPDRHPAWRVLTEPASARTWRELAYLVLSYLLGGIGLAYVLVAAYTGALLVITVIGLAQAEGSDVFDTRGSSSAAGTSTPCPARCWCAPWASPWSSPRRGWST